MGTICATSYAIFIWLYLKTNVHAFPTITDDIYMTWKETQDQRQNLLKQLNEK